MKVTQAARLMAEGVGFEPTDACESAFLKFPVTDLYAIFRRHCRHYDPLQANDLRSILVLRNLP